MICICGYELKDVVIEETNEVYSVCPNCDRIYKDDICISDFEEKDLKDNLMQYLEDKIKWLKEQYDKTWEQINEHPNGKGVPDKLQNAMILDTQIECFREIKNFIKVLEEEKE